MPLQPASYSSSNIGRGRYQLAPDFGKTLQDASEYADRMADMKRELQQLGLNRANADLAISGQGASPLIGRVLHPADNPRLQPRPHLLLDGIDGRVHYVDLRLNGGTEIPPAGTIVRVATNENGGLELDRKVAEVAAVNNGRYSADLHLCHDHSATDRLAAVHVRRLESLRQCGFDVERGPDGAWLIAADHPDRASTFEQEQAHARPVAIETLSVAPIEKLATLDAQTFLDQQLAAALPLRDAGFGKEFRAALIARRQWLIEEQLADGDQSSITLRPDALGVLLRREIERTAVQLAGELGKPFSEARVDMPFSGKVVRQVGLVSGKFALVERSRDFLLVPWRGSLGAQMGQEVTGILLADGPVFQPGRVRGLPNHSWTAT